MATQPRGLTEGEPVRRVGRRRAAGPARDRFAANDDGPSIGGLIFALQQRPSDQPFRWAAIGTFVWCCLGLLMGGALLAPQIAEGAGLLTVLTSPAMVAALATAAVPIAIMWFLALLIWRTQELRLVSSAMTEVAVRLAEPDRLAEHSIASLGQSVRRQVTAMNDAISRAIGRASELEVMVHNEVAALERAYDDNEHRIRGLIDELVSEREALANNSERVSETLRGVGQQITHNIRAAGSAVAEQLSERGNLLHSSVAAMSQRIQIELPGLLEKLGTEQGRLSKVVEAAGANLDQLQNALGERTGELEAALGIRTKQLQNVLSDYSTTIDSAMAEHTQTLGTRLEQLTEVIESTNTHIANVLADRTAVLDAALVERTKAIDSAFAARMHEIDLSIERSSMAVEGAITRGLQAVEDAVARGAASVDGAIGQRADVLRAALEQHASAISSTLHQQASHLDQTLLRSLEAVQRTSDVITQQSTQTVSGLAVQAKILQEVSEGLLSNIHGLTDRFESQTRGVVKATSQLQEMGSNFSNVAREVGSQVSSLSSEINRTSAQVAGLPSTALNSSEAMRRALGDQIKALETLSGITRQHAAVRDVTPPDPNAGRPSEPYGQPLSYASGTLATRPRALSAPPPAPAAAGSRDGWSLGDLLARASRDEGEGARPGQAEAAAGNAPALDLGALAEAIDPGTAASLWQRYRSGERGVFMPQVYSREGEAKFREIAQRVRQDAGFRAMIERYLADFERRLRETEERDPSGRLAQAQIMADTGRIYLLLAHACDRLA